jgi:hypothetical protein
MFYMACQGEWRLNRLDLASSEVGDTLYGYSRPILRSSTGNKRQWGSLFFGYFLLVKKRK